jgi:hypothetical protein
LEGEDGLQGWSVLERHGRWRESQGLWMVRC